MFHADCSSSSSSSENLSLVSSSDVTSQDSAAENPGYFAYILDTTATSNTSQSSSERINVSEMRRFKSGVNRDAGLVIDKKGNLYHGYRGELQLSIYMNYGLLTIHIKKGQSLKCEVEEYNATYVEVSLYQNCETNALCTTEAVPTINHPVFDEKFSFELTADDIDKRIVITVFQLHGSESVQIPEMIGCMSFGIKRLYEQPVSGWFYLLAGDIGTLKHRRVRYQQHAVSSRGKHRRRKRRKLPLTSNTFEIRHNIVVGVTEDGRGFSVAGESPSYVARVQPGSAASKSGLQTGDKITGVDGNDVSQLTSDDVARLIRNAGDKTIRLEILRRTSADLQADFYSLTPHRTSSRARYYDLSYVKRELPMPVARTEKLQTLSDRSELTSAPHQKSTRKIKNRHVTLSDVRKHHRRRVKGTTTTTDDPAIVELQQSPRRVHHRTRSASVTPPPPSSSPSPPPLPPERSRYLIQTRLTDISRDCRKSVQQKTTMRSTLADVSQTLSNVSDLYETLGENICPRNNDGSIVTSRPSDVSQTDKSEVLLSVKPWGNCTEICPTSVVIHRISNFGDSGVYMSMSRGSQQPSKNIGESHYVDMSSCRNHRRLSLETETSQMPVKSSKCETQQEPKESKLPSFTSSDLGGDYVQLNSISPAEHSNDIDVDHRHPDPFGLLHSNGVSLATYAGFYARSSTAVATSSDADYDVINVCQNHQIHGVPNNNKTTKAAASGPATVAVFSEATRISKTRRSTRHAIKDFLTGNLGKFL